MIKPKMLHTLYIALPEVWEKKLYSVYKECTEKYNNEYLDDSNWKAHIAIYTRLLSDKETDTFVELCQSSLSQTPPFHIHFKGFSQNKDGKYIFLDIDKAAAQKILQLRNDNLKLTNQKLGLPQIPNKYVEDDGRDYSSVEQKRLIKTGSPFKFTPHISIVKLNPYESDELLRELENHELLGEGFTANRLCISKQSDDPENLFPVIATIALQ